MPLEEVADLCRSDSIDCVGIPFDIVDQPVFSFVFVELGPGLLPWVGGSRVKNDYTIIDLFR